MGRKASQLDVQFSIAYVPLPKEQEDAWRTSLLLLANWIMEDLILHPEEDVIDERMGLEAALGALADHGECSPRVELRIRQAIRRGQLGPLLEPALEDLMRMVKDMADAKEQIMSAVDRLVE